MKVLIECDASLPAEGKYFQHIFLLKYEDYKT